MASPDFTPDTTTGHLSQRPPTTPILTLRCRRCLQIFWRALVDEVCLFDMIFAALSLRSLAHFATPLENTDEMPMA